MMLSCHSDLFNSNLPAMAAVVTLLFYNGDVRKGFTMYSRKAIDNLHCHVESGGPLIEGIVSAYLSSSKEQWMVTNRLLHGHIFSWVPGVPMIQNECNMDLASYHQPILYFFLVLTEHYGLNFAKSVG